MGVGLGACSDSGAPAAAPGADLRCREVYRPVRGRLLDRHGKLLVANDVLYTLTLPKGATFDSAAFNRLLGWPAGALQAQVAAARPPAGPLPPAPGARLHRHGPAARARPAPAPALARGASPD
ncbi:MAG: hypothetical protein WKG07_07480 [Hymenobacter sp.]